MNITAIKANLGNGKIKYQFKKENDGPLTYGDFIDLSRKGNEDFLSIFRAVLKNSFKELSCSYFWECIPVSSESINRSFEFVITPSTKLNSSKQDYSKFQEHFTKKNNEFTISFNNLGNDAILIVPVPKNHESPAYQQKILDYKDLANFSNNAHDRQWFDFWKKVGDKMSEILSKSAETKWLSSSGLGVSYLHVRIDDKPKYYNHDEYKYLHVKTDKKTNYNNKDGKKSEWNNQEAPPISPTTPPRGDKTNFASLRNFLIVVGLVIALAYLIYYIIYKKKVIKKTE